MSSPSKRKMLEAAPSEFEVDPQMLLRDPCASKKFAALVCSICFGWIPGLEAIAWRCNIWGRLAAINAILKVVFLVLAIVFWNIGGHKIWDAMSARQPIPDVGPAMIAAGSYLFIVYWVLYVVGIGACAACYGTASYGFIYKEEHERLKKLRRRLSAS